MKIAILTLPLHTNYGGILQAYALQTVLERMVHKVEILQKIPTFPHSKWLMPAVYAKRFVRKILSKSSVPVFVEQKVAKEKLIVEQYTSDFLLKYLNIRYIRSLREIQSTDYEAIVVGSDQVWRKSYFCPMWNAPIKDAFLDFTKEWNIKRIAYAASFGVENLNEYTSEEIRKCKNSIQLFDEVSVRESSGIDICKNLFGFDAIHLLDPTLLLSKDDYISLIEKSDTPMNPGNMLCYILDKTPFKNQVIANISKRQNLTPFFTNVEVDNYNLPVECRIQPPVEQWLRGFMDAEFVVTDSFHACVFSIIFQKPFIVIGNANRGMTRFLSLLKMFNMEKCMITESEQLNIYTSIYSTQSQYIIASYQLSANKFINNTIKPK